MPKVGVGRIDWNGDAFKTAVLGEMRKRVAASCMLVSNHAKVLLSVSGTGKAASSIVSKAGKKLRKGRRLYGSDPSKPGEPPHKQHNHLRPSVTWQMVRSLAGRGPSGRVGTKLPYGRWLELGTRTMAARPWLRRSLIEKREEIKALLIKPMNLKGR